MTDLADVFIEIADERSRQDAKWGEQNHRDGTGGPTLRRWAEQDRAICQEAFRKGVGTWRHILVEEVSEALAEDDPAKLRVELIQVAAVAVAWIEAIDRREAGRG
ncbi:MAG TPA: hypothetical protein VF506_06760 [Streptosporangiaceae bacterium]